MTVNLNNTPVDQSGISRASDPLQLTVRLVAFTAAPRGNTTHNTTKMYPLYMCVASVQIETTGTQCAVVSKTCLFRSKALRYGSGNMLKKDW